MDFASIRRSLIAAYLYRGKVLAWECSLCGKMFCRTLADAECDQNDSRPAFIDCAFQIHSCEAELLTVAEKRGVRASGIVARR